MQPLVSGPGCRQRPRTGTFHPRPRQRKTGKPPPAVWHQSQSRLFSGQERPEPSPAREGTKRLVKSAKGGPTGRPFHLREHRAGPASDAAFALPAHSRISKGSLSVSPPSSPDPSPQHMTVMLCMVASFRGFPALHPFNKNSCELSTCYGLTNGNFSGTLVATAPGRDMSLSRLQTKVF